MLSAAPGGAFTAKDDESRVAANAPAASSESHSGDLEATASGRSLPAPATDKPDVSSPTRAADLAPAGLQAGSANPAEPVEAAPRSPAASPAQSQTFTSPVAADMLDSAAGHEGLDVAPQRSEAAPAAPPASEAEESLFSGLDLVHDGTADPTDESAVDAATPTEAGGIQASSRTHGADPTSLI